MMALIGFFMVLTGFILATAAPKPSDQHSAELACFIYHREEDSFDLLLDLTGPSFFKHSSS